MILKVSVRIQYVILLMVLPLIGGFLACSKESRNTVRVEYQLETSDITADHFYVTYLNEHADTVVRHEHAGWKYSFSVNKPFDAYLKTEVYPIDTYVFIIKILRDGQVVQQDSASTASGARKTVRLAYTAN